MKMIKIIKDRIGVLALSALLLCCAFLASCSSSECGIENCHGLDITCGPDIPQACTLEYRLGDFCRQYAECSVINSRCQFVESQEFKDCKACVQNCEVLQQAQDAFSCEEDCRQKIDSILS